MMAVKRALFIETVLVAVHPPALLRQNALEPTFIVWMAATVLMVFNYPLNICYIVLIEFFPLNFLPVHFLRSYPS